MKDRLSESGTVRSRVDRRMPLVVFEGIDGAGKTTLRNEVWNGLLDLGIPTVAMGQHSWLGVDDAILIGQLRSSSPDAPRPVQATAEEIRLAYLRDKELHWSSNIMPALREAVVLLDRSFISDIVYLKALYDVPMRLSYNAVRSSAIGLPDLLIFLDMDAGEAERRVARRGRETRHYEHEGPLGHLRDVYRAMFAEFCSQGQLYEEEFMELTMSTKRITHIAAKDIMCHVESLVNPNEQS